MGDINRWAHDRFETYRELCQKYDVEQKHWSVFGDFTDDVNALERKDRRVNKLLDAGGITFNDAVAIVNFEDNSLQIIKDEMSERTA